MGHPFGNMTNRLGSHIALVGRGRDPLNRFGQRGVSFGRPKDAPMAETITIPAHIHDGEVRLDGPLPSDVDRIEVLVHRRTMAASGHDLIAFLDALPRGKRTRAELDARLDAERSSWPD